MFVATSFSSQVYFAFSIFRHISVIQKENKRKRSRRLGQGKEGRYTKGKKRKKCERERGGREGGGGVRWLEREHKQRAWHNQSGNYMIFHGVSYLRRNAFMKFVYVQ